MDRSNYIHNYFTLLADKKTPAGTGLMKEEKYKNDKVYAFSEVHKLL